MDSIVGTEGWAHLLGWVKRRREVLSFGETGIEAVVSMGMTEGPLIMDGEAAQNSSQSDFFAQKIA